MKVGKKKKDAIDKLAERTKYIDELKKQIGCYDLIDYTKEAVFSINTRVLTKDGVKGIDSISKQDSIYTYDIASGRVHYEEGYEVIKDTQTRTPIYAYKIAPHSAIEGSKNNRVVVSSTDGIYFTKYEDIEVGYKALICATEEHKSITYSKDYYMRGLIDTVGGTELDKGTYALQKTDKLIKILDTLEIPYREMIVGDLIEVGVIAKCNLFDKTYIERLSYVKGVLDIGDIETGIEGMGILITDSGIEELIFLMSTVGVIPTDISDRGYKKGVEFYIPAKIRQVLKLDKFIDLTESNNINTELRILKGKNTTDSVRLYYKDIDYPKELLKEYDSKVVRVRKPSTKQIMVSTYGVPTLT